VVSKLLTYGRLVVQMSRPPVAAILLLFASIAAVQVGNTLQLGWRLLPSLVIIVAILINAAALNDLADEQIDKVNLPGATARPLANNQATKLQIWVLALASAGLAFIISCLVGNGLVWTALFGIGFNWAYSMKPLYISRRSILAPLLLPLAYVVTPYLIGLLSVHQSLDSQHLMLLAGLYVCFVGRILLKDFRDVEGDKLFGKTTFLLRYDRSVTCIASSLFWVLGGAILALLNPIFAGLFALYIPFILVALYFLKNAKDKNAEQIIIWSIARVGTAIAIAIFALLQVVGKPLGYQVILMLGIGVPFVGMYISALKGVVRLARPSLASSHRFVDVSKNLPVPLREPYW